MLNLKVGSGSIFAPSAGAAVARAAAANPSPANATPSSIRRRLTPLLCSFFPSLDMNEIYTVRRGYCNFGTPSRRSPGLKSRAGSPAERDPTCAATLFFFLRRRLQLRHAEVAAQLG